MRASVHRCVCITCFDSLLVGCTCYVCREAPSLTVSGFAEGRSCTALRRSKSSNMFSMSIRPFCNCVSGF